MKLMKAHTIAWQMLHAELRRHSRRHDHTRSGVALAAASHRQHGQAQQMEL